MREHVHFGRPPNLRPRSAGISSVASPHAVAPQQLANEAVRSNAAATLSERLQIPHPGSATTAVRARQLNESCHGAPVATAVSSVGVTQPTMLLSKPPMRPRSALPGSQKVVSHHRMELLLGTHATASRSVDNQDGDETRGATAEKLNHHQAMLRDLAPQLQRAVVNAEKGGHVQPASTTTTTLNSAPIKRPLKRPFSAAPSIATSPQKVVISETARRASRPELDSTQKSNQRSLQESESSTPRVTRPFSAATAVRGSSPRTSALQIASLGRSPAASGKTESVSEAQVTRTQSINAPSGARSVMASFQRDTFVYAVPRHCLERGRQYNPYDIVTISHEALFGTNLSMRMSQEARCDFYTVSATAMTFHCKDDNFEPTLLTSREWERQRVNFSRICKLRTFQMFRYRKVFIGWKKWIRSTKMERARAGMQSSLYFAQPMLNLGMKIIRAQLVKLDDVNLVCDLGGDTFHFSQFSTKNRDHVQTQGVEILKVNNQIQQILLQVCQEFLSSTENPYGGFPGQEFALSTRKSSNFHIFETFVEREHVLVTANHQLVQHHPFQSDGAMQTSQLPLFTAAQLRTTHRKYMERVIRAQKQRPQDTQEEIRWTLAAIQRRRCLSLAKFVSLVDFMVLDALHSILVRSTQMVRDCLWVGSNAVPISKLLDRRDYVLAFHKTLSRGSPDHLSGSGRITNSCAQSNLNAGLLSKQQLKRFLRSTWEAKLPRILRATDPDAKDEENVEGDGASQQQLPSSASVWLGSRLDAFFSYALREICGDTTELFSIDDAMLVVDPTLARALVLPDFDASQCSIITPCSDETSKDSSTDGWTSIIKELQQIECLKPAALLHMILTLRVDESTNHCVIDFQPTLDHVPNIIQDMLSSFVELFRGIPSVVLHHEIRAVLEFAEDFQASTFVLGEDNHESIQQQYSSVAGGDSEDESCWNKSNYDRLFARIGNDHYCSMLRVNIDELIRSATTGAEAFARSYEEVLAKYANNESIDFTTFQTRFRRGNYPLKEMEADVRAFRTEIEVLSRLKTSQTIECLQFSMIPLNDALSPSPVRCLQQLHTLFPVLALEKCDAFLVFVRAACKRIEKPLEVGQLNAFARYLLQLREVQHEVQENDFDLSFVHDMIGMLRRLEIHIPAKVSEAFDLCDPEFEALKAQLNESMARKDADILERSPILAEHIKKLQAGIDDLKTNSADQAINAVDCVASDARRRANALEKESEALIQQSVQLVWIQRVVSDFAAGSRPPLDEFVDLQVVSNELRLKNELWESVNDIEDYLKIKQEETLREIDLGQLRTILAKVDAVVKRLQQKALQIAAVKRLETSKSVLENLSPVIRDLRNDHLDERHWTKLEHKMNCSFVRTILPTYEPNLEIPDDDAATPTTESSVIKYLDLPLRHLLEIEAVNHASLIHQVAEEATAEAAIMKSFQSVSQTWETREIPNCPRKDRDGRDAVCLGECTEMLTLLEESEVLLRVMESSSFARVIHSKLAKLLHDLAYTKETMELLVVCQQKREHLQRLVSVDFVRSFPEQNKHFQTHDANWKSIMDGIANRPLCLPFGTNTEYRQRLQATLQGFEVASQFVEQHLEIKRELFPGFFKLSNTELAALLSKLRDINAVQQVLFQCFDNVGRVNFGTREAWQDVLSLTSRSFPHAEIISMGKNLKARGPPEQWLGGIEKRLVEMLRKATKEAVLLVSQASDPSTSTFDVATLCGIPLQSILLADRILRSELIDSLLLESDGSESFGAFSLAAQTSVHDRLREFNMTVVERVVGSNTQDTTAMALLSPREIVLLSSLRLHEIEFRDAIDQHVMAVTDPVVTTGNSARSHGMHWQFQLKHRFDDSTTVGYDCHVEIGGTRVLYGFNYVNVNAELAFTPRSMRFVFSVFAATRHGHAALLTGQRGSGKQSLALQASRLFGRRFFGLAVSDTTSAAQSLCQVAHCLTLLRGALLAGGVLCVGLRMQEDDVNLFRVLGSTIARIQHSVLCKLPITGLQNDPITWIPGTTLIFTCDLISPTSPRWSSLQYKLDVATTSFARITGVVDHDMGILIEALMGSKQLEAPQRTARKLDDLWLHFRSLDIIPQYLFTLQTAKHIIATVAEDMWRSTEPFEREKLQNLLLCEAVMSLCTPLFLIGGGEAARSCVVAALEQFFQYKVHEGEWYVRQWKRSKTSELETKNFEETIDEAAQELHYVPRHQLAKKAMELASGLAVNVGVVMVGPSGGGKSTTCTVLSQALNKLKCGLVTQSNAQNTAQPDSVSANIRISSLIESSATATLTKPSDSTSEPFVKICVLLPMSLTLSQLFGSTGSDAKGHVKSVLGRLIREAQESFALSTDHEIRFSMSKAGGTPAQLGPLFAMQKLMWVVFDGGSVCGGPWLDSLVTILSRKYMFGLLDYCVDPSRDLVQFSDGEFMTIPPNLRFVFDTWNLENATPAILQHCTVVVFPPDDEIDRDKDEEDSIPVHFACIQRFLDQQRLAATFGLDGTTLPPALIMLSAVVYDTIADHLLGTDVLGKLVTVMEDYDVAVPIALIHRVEYMLALLQALLNSVAASCAASQKTEDGSSVVMPLKAIPQEDVQHRVEMAIVYALLWGFSTCCAHGKEESRCRALQLLISGILKTQFESISHTWEECGRDANLFELLLDLNGLRFVSLESGDTKVLRDKLWRHTKSATVTHGAPRYRQPNNAFHSLFIPTRASLIVHAAMREAIRSARGVLLVGSDTSRKTTLLQNFLKQLESVRLLTTSNYASIPVPAVSSGGDAVADSGVAKRKRGMARIQAPLISSAETAYASLDRIRVHQVDLVRRLAKRFRKVNKATAAAAALAAAQRYGSTPSLDGEKASKASKRPPAQWALRSHLESRKTDMVHRFDNGDFIPFFFAMNQHDHGVGELANCLERMLQRERSGVFEPPPGKAAVLIIDDLHLPVMQNDEQHPSCHEYLRSAYEHSTVLSPNVEAGARAITIENLMMVASISSRAMASGGAAFRREDAPFETRHFSLDKLTKQFLPVYAPPCSPLELHTIFHTMVLTHWERQNAASPLDKLSSVVRLVLPVIVAATTVLWERLRRRQRAISRTGCDKHHVSALDLHSLLRVYAGVCAVEPKHILDTETMIRLWSHETIKSFSDESLPGWKSHLKRDVFRIRILLDGIDNEQYGSSSNAGETGMPTLSQPTAARDGEATKLNTKSSLVVLLSFFSSVLLDPNEKTAGNELVFSPQQRAVYERKKLHVVPMWAFVPSSLYYQTNSGGSALTTDEINAPPASPVQRRHSIRFIRRKSLENVIDEDATAARGPSFSGSSKAASLGNVKWIYVELPLLEDVELDGDDVAIQSTARSVFSAVRVFSAVTHTKPVTDLVLQTMVGQLPRGAPSVTPLLARSIATLERVFTPEGSRSVLVAPPNSGREILIRYACAVRQTSQPHTVLTVEGVADADVMLKQWKHVVLQLFQRVGVDYESVTLVGKRLPLWPQHLVSQLLALIVSGEIPGAFSLEEQIQLATRVRDERLLEIDQRYQAHVTRIRQEAEMDKERDMLASRDDAKTATKTTSKAANLQELEQKYQQTLLVRLSQAQLRHQQELDDFLRMCEVESESVTATIMSLMRPLGTTSGKWQQIVQRMRKRLRIVVLVDYDDLPAIETQAPRLLRICGVASLAPIDGPSLQTLLYGSFRSEVQNALRLSVSRSTDSASGTQKGINEREQLSQFVARVEQELPKITAVAADMFACARALAAKESRKISTELAVTAARFFAKLLKCQYEKERDERRQVEWFTYVHSSMEMALWKLQDADGTLRSQLERCDQQIEVSQELLTDQQEDCNRIRDMMKRYQKCAEDQVQVTNEMELRAQAELHAPMACLEEANAALLLIDKRHIIEIKSFNSPPLLVHLVLDAICVLFQFEPTWENARKILSDSNVVQTLLTFDKENISNEILAKVETAYISDPRFYREQVEKQSVAASMMVVWVRAMYQYATARRQVLPTLEKLAQAQSRLRMLVQEYQVSKQRVSDADEALAKTNETLETAHALRRQTLDEMESRKTRLEGGRVVLECLVDDKREADRTLQQLDEEAQLGLTWWNALLSAGVLAYSSLFEASDRMRLYEQWGQAYRQSTGSECDKIEISYVPAVAISVKEEAQTIGAQRTTSSASDSDASQDPVVLFRRRCQDWEFASACGCLFSKRTLQDAFLLTQAVRAGFPVVMVTSYSSEMEDLLVQCARSVWEWTQFSMVSVNSPELLTTIAAAVKDGHQLLILDVGPLDIEYRLGKLWSLFHWHHSTSTDNGDTVDYLILTSEDDVATVDASSDSGSDLVNQTRIPIHPGFRAVLSTYQVATAFGDTLLTRVPVVSAKLHTHEIADLLLDRMWYPDLCEDGPLGSGLKQSVREYKRLRLQQDDAATQLTQLIQGTAVRGQFQSEESDLIRATCKKTRDTREALEQMHREVDERIKSVEKHKSIARLGAAIFNGLNVARDSGQQEKLLLHVFLPVFLSNVKKPPALTSPAGRIESGICQESNMRGPRKLSTVAQQQQHSSTFLAVNSPRETGFDTVGEILKKLLQQLMPLVRDVTDWYQCVLHVLWTLERQGQVGDFGGYDAAQEATVKSSNETTSCSVRRVRQILSMAKLSRGKSHAQRRDYEAFPLDPQNNARLVSIVVSGLSTAATRNLEEKQAPTSEEAWVVPPVLATSNSRAERVQIAVSMYPELIRSMCDTILQLYGVHVRFSPCELDDQALTVPRGSIPTKKASVRDVANERIDEQVCVATSPRRVRGGWLGIGDEFPASAGVVVCSDHPFGSYEFLQRVFHSTMAPGNTRGNVLKVAMGRLFRSSSELDEVFYLPTQRFQSSDTKDDHGSTLSEMSENVLMVRDVPAMLELEPNKFDAFLDDVTLAILNLQDGGELAKRMAYWEDLYHLISSSPDRTTSRELRRFHCANGSRHKTVVAVSVHSETEQRPLTAADAVVSRNVSTRRPTARRVSTHSLPRRQSASETPMESSSKTPSFMVIVPDIVSIPPHLRASTVAFATEATEFGSNRVPSFKKTVQEALVRMAFHPCGDLLRQLAGATPHDAPSKTQQEGGDTNDSVQEAKAFCVQLWQHLAVLIVYHAILAVRWQLSLRQYANDPSAERCSADRYSLDVLTTAVDQLLHMFLQMRSFNKFSTSLSPQQRAIQFRLRVHHHVFIANYTRQSRGRYEETVVRLLCRECLSLIPEITTRVDQGTAATITQPNVSSHTAHPPGSSNARSMRSHRVLQATNSSLSQPVSSIATAPPSGRGALSGRPSIRHSAVDLTSLPRLAGLNLPLEMLERSCQDADGWIDTMWSYTNSIDSSIENLVCETFGLQPPVEIALTLHPDSSNMTTPWTELFGWLTHPVRYDSVPSQIALKDALECLELIYKRAITPLFDLVHGVQDQQMTLSQRGTEKGVSKNYGDDDHDGNKSGSIKEEVGRIASEADAHKVTTRISNENLSGMKMACTVYPPPGSTTGRQILSRAENSHVGDCTQAPADMPSTTTALLGQQIFEAWCISYNTHVRAVQAILRASIDGLRFWEGQQLNCGAHGDHGEQTLASVANKELQDNVLAILCDRVPTPLRRQVAASPTYLLASSDVSLDALVTHYQCVYRNLQQRQQLLQCQQRQLPYPGSSSVPFLEWWLPGVPTRIQIAHILALASRPAVCKEDAKLTPDGHDEASLVFSLVVEQTTPSYTEPGIATECASNNGEADDSYPNGTITVFSGLELRLALWDTERGYLQALDRSSARVPQRVKIVCQLDDGRPGATRQNSVQHPHAKYQPRSTRSCPLLLRDRVAYEFELPIGPAFGPFVAPYLTFSLP